MNFSDPLGLNPCAGLLGCLVQFVKNEWHGFTTPLNQGPPAGGSFGWALSRLMLPMGTAGTPAALGSGAAAAGSEAATTAEMSGMLRDAAAGTGNFGVGSTTTETADEMGRAWVGKNFTVSSDGKTLVSADELRQYRPPAMKPQLGRLQANLEWRFKPSGAWQANAHVDIIP